MLIGGHGSHPPTLTNGVCPSWGPLATQLCVEAERRAFVNFPLQIGGAYTMEWPNHGKSTIATN